MPVEAGADAAFRRLIEADPDPEAKRKEIEGRLHDFLMPLGTQLISGVTESPLGYVAIKNQQVDHVRQIGDRFYQAKDLANFAFGQPVDIVDNDKDAFFLPPQDLRKFIAQLRQTVIVPGHGPDGSQRRSRQLFRCTCARD